MPFRGSDKIYNSRLAQELGLWGDSKGRGDEIHFALFKAYFVEGRNIAKIPVLVEVASAVKLPVDEAAEILSTRAFRAAVDEDWALAREKSVTAVPTFIVGQDRLVGAQPYEALQMLVEGYGASRKSLA